MSPLRPRLRCQRWSCVRSSCDLVGVLTVVLPPALRRRLQGNEHRRRNTPGGGVKIFVFSAGALWTIWPYISADTWKFVQGEKEESSSTDVEEIRDSLSEGGLQIKVASKLRWSPHYAPPPFFLDYFWFHIKLFRLSG